MRHQVARSCAGRKAGQGLEHPLAPVPEAMGRAAGGPGLDATGAPNSLWVCVGGRDVLRRRSAAPAVPLFPLAPPRTCPSARLCCSSLCFPPLALLAPIKARRLAGVRSGATAPQAPKFIKGTLKHMDTDDVPEAWVDCPQCDGKGFLLGLAVRVAQRHEQRTKTRCRLCDGLGIVDALTDAANKAQSDLFDGTKG